jgi:thiamine-phosphate pyrophosphorylase
MRGLYLVTDRGLCLGRPLAQVVEQAVLGGVTCVQIREKDLSTREFVAEAEQIQALLAPRGVPLIINDRVDVALAVGAAGVHLGQSDLPCEIARRLLGPTAIIGLSVETWDDVERAAHQPVDYLGVSPIFASPTKTDTKQPWGLPGLARVRAFTRLPLVAIGGLNRGNVAQVLAAGADGIAVVSALCSAPDPAEAAAELCAIIG